MAAELLSWRPEPNPSPQGRKRVAEDPKRLPKETDEADGDHEAGQ